jgi:hypothetical protein
LQRAAGVSRKTVVQLLRFSLPDWHLVGTAFLAGSLAALAQVWLV